MLQVSVICPVKNEEASIERLLSGLAAQTLLPAELVITDGGSTDQTREQIRRWQPNSPFPIKLIEVAQALPGRGRNLAIRQAQHTWLAFIDAGIVPAADWLQKLVETAVDNPQAQVVFGSFKPAISNYFTECAALVYASPIVQQQPVLPSTLMQRTAWEAAGGFREDLRSAEDLLFFRALRKAGINEVRCPQAVVTWELAPGWRATFRRFSVYSQHSLNAGLGWDWQWAVSRYYAILLLLSALSLMFGPWSLCLPAGLVLARTERRIYQGGVGEAVSTRWRELLSPRRVVWVFGINLVIDSAMFYGMYRWWRTPRGSA